MEIWSWNAAMTQLFLAGRMNHSSWPPAGSKTGMKGWRGGGVEGRSIKTWWQVPLLTPHTEYEAVAAVAAGSWCSSPGFYEDKQTWKEEGWAAAILIMINWKLYLQVDSKIENIFQLPVGLFFMVGARSFCSIKANLNTEAYRDILHNRVLPTLWQKFGKGPFLLQHYKALAPKARPMKRGFSEFGIKELTSLQNPTFLFSTNI